MARHRMNAGRAAAKQTRSGSTTWTAATRQETPRQGTEREAADEASVQVWQCDGIGAGLAMR
eukprot:366381-Chlamydomonas_euryale.AAC.12